MKRLVRHTLAGVSLALLAACGGGSDSTSDDGPMLDSTPRAGASARLAPNGGARRQVLDVRLRNAKGPQRVWVSLAEPSLASFRAAQLESAGLDMQARALDSAGRAQALSAAEAPQRSALALHRGALRDRQADVLTTLRGLGARELGRVTVAHNAVAVRVDASALTTIATLSGVVNIRPVIDYRLDLSETVPYVGGTAVQASGRTGAGVRVAVLDSGIDYTHRNLGGAGTPAAYAAAYGADPSDPKNTTRDGLFPTRKVVGGFDFVGEVWPNAPAPGVDAIEVPDPDPIDFEGHGTHVADIIAGRSADGRHKGMAPDATLYAVKVCSAVDSACSGVALLQGMDYALDPNADGDMADAVDVINLSLGSDYAQAEDDLTLATENAVKLGVVVVASAGNGANKPYVVGSPSTGRGVISVAQTQTPSAVAVPLVINAPAAIAGSYPNTETLDFAPIGAGVSGDVAYIGRACPADSIDPGVPADPLLASPAGKIALIDRGACSVSLKIDNAVRAGATGVLIGLIAPGDAVGFSFGGGTEFRPTLVIQQGLAASIKAKLAAGVNVSMSKAAAIALKGSMAPSSSRGPAGTTQHIKPEIGAPGASVSASAGTGDGETAFGGTSGAAPMISGAVALLIEAYPNRSPERLKATLMNSAETVVYTNPALVPGELAPISRIGAGELRVNRAIGLTSLAWNRKQTSAALAFGALEVDAPTLTDSQTLRVENLSGSSRSYTVTPSFRYPGDAASGAVRVIVKPTLQVGARGAEELEVKLAIDPAKLPVWALDGGPGGGDGAALNGPEFDGFLTLTSGAEKLTVPWHVLPRRAARTEARWADPNRSDPNGGALRAFLGNSGRAVGEFDVFSLLARSPRLPRSALPGPGDNFVAVDLAAVGARFVPESEAICGEPGGCLEFAIGTHGRRPHPATPGGFEIDVDTNDDGQPDFAIYNEEDLVGTPSATGQTLVWALDLATGDATAFFYADADFNSGNIILTVAMDQLALRPGTTIGLSVFAYDNYFSPYLTSDELTGMRFTPGTARYAAAGHPYGAVPARSGGRIDITRSEVPAASSTEQGVLLMYRRNAGREFDALVGR